MTAPWNPPRLPRAFQVIGPCSSVMTLGYLFVMYLPSRDTPPWGLPDIVGGGADPKIGVDECETFWCAYAWPLETGVTGTRAFFANQGGVVYQTAMTATQYSGQAGAPWPSAALATYGMNAPVAGSGRGGIGVDGNAWTPVP